MIEKSLDYLQYSIDIKHCPIDSASEKIAPMRTYKTGYRGSWGEKIYLGNPNTDKPLIVMSATAIHNWSIHMSIEDFISEQLSYGAKFSRADWQVTQFVTDSLILPIDYAHWQSDGKIETKPTWNVAPKFIAGWLDKKVNVETLYMGNMKKRGRNGIVRVYDKGLDLGSFANAVIRLEVEEKRDNAHVSINRFVDGADVGSIIKSRFNVLDDNWQNMIASPSIDITRGEQIADDNEPDVWNWLFNQVAKSLGKAIAQEALSGQSRKFNHFNDLVTKAYGEHISKFTNGLSEQ